MNVFLRAGLKAGRIFVGCVALGVMFGLMYGSCRVVVKALDEMAFGR